MAVHRVAPGVEVYHVADQPVLKIWLATVCRAAEVPPTPVNLTRVRDVVLAALNDLMGAVQVEAGPEYHQKELPR